METMEKDQRITAMQKKLEEIQNRIPPHSVPPSMMEEIEALEEEIERLRRG